MSFLNLFMLFGILAAGIPVAIHLFFRSRYRTVPWAAMKFLLTSIEQTSRRLKFQELILLLLRMALLALLAFAFARPISQIVRGSGRGEAVDAVFVFDLSYSMSAQDGAKTRLERAKEEALKIIDELPGHSTVQIVTCAGSSKGDLGPRSPANLELARQLIKDLDLTHLSTDLSVGAGAGQSALERCQASNKELYILSDMQRSGFEAEADRLKSTLNQVKEKAIVHFVRCGTRPVKNAAIVGITPQSGVPRPGERVGFAVVVKNTGSEAVENVKISLVVDGDEKNPETTVIAKLPGGDTRAVTLTAKLAKPGLRLLTARIAQDDVPGDNRFDQVILVRDQVNILVVDGALKESDPARSASFFLMHALLPVKDIDRSNYHLQPRVVPARLASPALLAKQDICILVNCALAARRGSEVLPSDFVDALDPFVRKEGHGLVIFGGENVQPDPYNKSLGKKLGLLPLALRAPLKAGENKPFLVDRNSFGAPAFWKFKEDEYYKDFAKVEVWQALEMDEKQPIEKDPPKVQPKDDAGEKEKDKEKVEPPPAPDNPVNVLLRLNTGNPLVVARKVDAGEVIMIATAADPGTLDEKTFNPTWTDWPFRLGMYVPFIDVTMSHLLHGQTQTYNLKAGDVLNWYPTDKLNHVYELHQPGGEVERLNPPQKKGKRFAVTATDLPRAGIYHMTATPRGAEGSKTAGEAIKAGMPIAVTPDLRESEDMQTLSSKEIDDRIGFPAVHIVAGEEVASTGAERLNREWTVWVLLAVFILLLVTVAFAWWCSKAF